MGGAEYAIGEARVERPEPGWLGGMPPGPRAEHSRPRETAHRQRRVQTLAETSRETLTETLRGTPHRNGTEDGAETPTSRGLEWTSNQLNVAALWGDAGLVSARCCGETGCSSTRGARSRCPPHSRPRETPEKRQRNARETLTAGRPSSSTRLSGRRWWCGGRTRTPSGCRPALRHAGTRRGIEAVRRPQ